MRSMQYVARIVEAESIEFGRLLGSGYTFIAPQKVTLTAYIFLMLIAAHFGVVRGKGGKCAFNIGLGIRLPSVT